MANHKFFDAWRDDISYAKRAIGHLKVITGEDFGQLEDWKKWWQEYKRGLDE
ncbi:MAG: hypothetical protein WBB67_02155 [bacterium]